MQRQFPNGHKFPFGCNGFVTAMMAVGQRQWLYSGFWCQNVECLPGIISVPLPGTDAPEGSYLN
jgi:hypothetical protein